jgi:mono/diheme cytochrome c family protein
MRLRRMMGIAVLLAGVWLVGRPATTLSGEQSDANPAALSKGIGPINEVKLGALDAALADRGKATFEEKCSACHKFDERYVGPALGGVTRRRAPEWIMNMILNPQEMIMEDPIAQELLAEYFVPMTFQNVTAEEARAILEFFRRVDAGGAADGAAK